MRLKLTGAPQGCHASVERIDENHANATRLWREMGAPEYLSAAEVERLGEASRMLKEPQRCEYVNGVLQLEITLPPHAVAAITIDFPSEQASGGVDI